MKINGKLILSIVYLSVLSVTIPLLTHCGYHLSGAGSNLPEGVKTIAIPDFENNTASPDAQQFITFAIKDEFIRRSRLTLADDISAADLVLEGKIKRFSVTPVSFTEHVSANLYKVSLTLEVKLIDTENNRVLYSSKSLRFSDDYDIDNADFFTQETATIGKIAEDIASTIVSGILENF